MAANAWPGPRPRFDPASTRAAALPKEHAQPNAASDAFAVSRRGTAHRRVLLRQREQQSEGVCWPVGRRDPGKHRLSRNPQKRGVESIARIAPALDEARNCAVAERGGRRRADAPHRSGSTARRPTLAALPAPRLCDAYNRGLVGPIACYDCRPPPKTKAKVSGRSSSTRSCIGIMVRSTPACIVDLAVAIADSKRARSGPATIASALPSPPASLCLCQGLRSRAAGRGLLHFPG